MILVTGSAGFIGSKVAELLLASGEDVLGIDNLNDAYDPRLKEWRLARLQDRPGLTFRRTDITDRRALSELFSEFPIDAVINLAARAGVRQSVEDPWIFYETNLVGTLNLLDACRASHVPKFVLSSTSSVYGDAKEMPFVEERVVDRPLSPYAASKRAAELLSHTYHYLYGIDVTILRYFTVYGPAGRPDMSLFRFVRWIAEEQQLQLYGDGSQRRDFTYVDDIAKGTVLALKPLGYEIINLGSDRPVSLRSAIELIEGHLGKTARIDQRAPQQADVPATWADISKARRLLGWEPSTGLEQGLAQASDWYIHNRDFAQSLDLGRV